MPEPLQVTAAEAGQKLLQFLSRRFEEPQSVLHRWIRTGQVRIDPETAEADACRIEHDISAETYERLKELVTKE